MGHDILRNELFAHAKRGAAAPNLEAAGVLNALGMDEVGAGCRVRIGATLAYSARGCCGIRSLWSHSCEVMQFCARSAR